MLESIINAVKEVAGQTVASNQGVPNEHQSGVVDEAINSIKGGLEGAVSSGNIQSLTNLFSGNESVENNGTVQQISGNFVQNITQKFGLANQSGALSSIIPSIFNMVKSKLGSSAGGGGLQDILSKFSGVLDQNHDGKVDLSDASSLLSGGGLMDKLKGLLGGKE